MKIGIDARLFGPKDTGIGRYVENLVLNLLAVDSINQYVLFVRKAVRDEVDIKILRYKDIKCRTVVAEVGHYSFKEQLLMPYLIWREKVNLMHFPHFNVPVFFFGKYLVTIHDLIKHTSQGAATTTRNPLFYRLKFLGYKIIFWLAVKKAKKILVPSKTVALQLRKVYGVSEDKVGVTYEGVDDKLKIKNQSFDMLRIDPERSRTGQKSKIKNVLEKYDVKKPFLLYVGSVYPHKNIPNLIKAIKILNQSLTISHPDRLSESDSAGRQPPTTNHQSPITLVIVCARSVFWERLENEVESQKVGKFIKMVGFVPDEELQILYKEAEAFVFPSESEGFGLPGLEAMANGLPVLASDIPVFREIYQNAALYFDPKNPGDIVLKIKELLSDKNLQQQLKTKGPKLAEGYSWAKMAKETLNEYQSV